MRDYEDMKSETQQLRTNLPPRQAAKPSTAAASSRNQYNDDNDDDQYSKYSQASSNHTRKTSTTTTTTVTPSSRQHTSKTLGGKKEQFGDATAGEEDFSNNYLYNTTASSSKPYSVTKYHNNSSTGGSSNFLSRGNSRQGGEGEEQNYDEGQLKNAPPSTQQRRSIQQYDDDEERAPAESGGGMKRRVDNSASRMQSRFQKAEEGLLICTEGCGRTFNEFALERHVKVCKKVFQSKREVYETVLVRAPSKPSEQVMSADEERRQEIKRKRNELHECPDCGRQFQFETYEKHVKICLKVFTKKGRENSLNRKVSSDNNNLATTATYPNKPVSMNTAVLERQNSKKLGGGGGTEAKKPPIRKDDKKEVIVEKKEQRSSHAWDDIPVGVKKSNPWTDDHSEYEEKGKQQQAWERGSEEDVGSRFNGGDKQKAASTLRSVKQPTNTSKRPAWNDDYSQEGNNNLQQQQQQPNVRQQKEDTSPLPFSKAKRSSLGGTTQQKQQPQPWNDDWDSKEDEHEAYSDSRQKKNYNFNKQVRNSHSAIPASSSVQSSQKISECETNDIDDGGEEFEANFVYSKPNIGKNARHSANKQHSSSSKYEGNSSVYDGEEESSERRTPAMQGKAKQQEIEAAAAETMRAPVVQRKEDFSKPFLRKNQGMLTNKVKPAAASTAAYQQKTPQQNIIEEPVRYDDDIPLQKNTDFNRMMLELDRKAKLEEKQNSFNGGGEYGDESGGGELIECPEGCGRKFLEGVLIKHAKVCKKVFQQKRKVFNSAAHRVTDELNEIQQQTYPALPGLKKKQAVPPQQKPAAAISPINGGGQKPPPTNPFAKKAAVNESTKVGKKMPDWKLQSEAFRAVMRQNRGGTENTAYEKALIKEAFTPSDYVQCDHCGRKFNSKAAERHIPHCKSKMEKEKYKNPVISKAAAAAAAKPQNQTASSFKSTLTKQMQQQRRF